MDKKVVKVFGRFFVVMASIVAILSIAALALILLSIFIPNFEYGTWFVPVFGEFLLPLQMLISPNESNAVIFIIVAVVIFALTVISSMCAKRIYKFSTKSKKASLITTLIMGFILFAYSIFNLVVICIYYEIISAFVSSILATLIQGFDVGTFTTIFMIKYIIICLLMGLSSILVFFVFLLNREKEKKQVVKQLFNLNFYSDEYEKKEAKEEMPTKNIKEEEVKPEEPKQKPKKQSQDLLERIMQLNELKDTGQITEVEYTRLRQKAIRRYKV